MRVLYLGIIATCIDDPGVGIPRTLDFESTEIVNRVDSNHSPLDAYFIVRTADWLD